MLTDIAKTWEVLTPDEQQEISTLVSGYEFFQFYYWDKPDKFVLDCIKWDTGEEPAFYQLDALVHLPREKRISVRSLHGTGKTALVSWLVLWFALTRDGKDWKIPTTASVYRQLTKYLWPEIRKWARKLDWVKIGRAPFKDQSELLTLSLKLKTGEAFAMASNKPESLEGAHADHLLYIFDESKAIPDSTFDAAEGAFSTQGLDSDKAVFVVSIGTPGEPQGRFYDIQSRKRGYEDWWVKHINLKEALKAKRVSLDWVNQRKLQWGENSPVFLNRVMGEFASSAESTVIPLQLVERAIQRWQEWRDQGSPVYRFTGVGADIGGGGEGDANILALCYDEKKISELRKYPADDPDTATMQMAGRIKGILDSKGGVASIDTVGIGLGTLHRLREQGYVKRARAFIAQGKTHLKDQTGELGFVNNRSAAWWLTREMLQDNLVLLPDDDQLIGDLTAPKYKHLSEGNIQVESKEIIKKRLRRSTDCGDAVVQILNRQLSSGSRTVKGYHGLA